MNAHIVVAESEPALQTLIASTLRRRGHKVLNAASGDAALELIARMEPDLVVLDGALRASDGATVAQRLGSTPDTAELPVVQLIHKADSADQRAWLSGGIHDALVQPFAPRDLVAKVERMLAAVRERSREADTDA